MSDISENSESLLTIVSAAEQPGFVTTSDPPKENAIDRRQLFRAAAPWVGGVFGIAALGLDVPRAMAQVVASAEAALPVGHPTTKRWIEQRCVLDNIVQANGVDWDQPRSQY